MNLMYTVWLQKKYRGTKTLGNALIYKNLDISKPIAAVFLDLAKTFNTGDYKILTEKLYNTGIRRVALELIKSY